MDGHWRSNRGCRCGVMSWCGRCRVECGVCDLHVGFDGSARGVAVSHGGLVDLAVTAARGMAVPGGGAGLGFVSPSFDVSVLIICWRRRQAGRMLVYRPGSVVGGVELERWIVEHGVEYGF